MNKEERFLDSSSTIILGGLLLVLGILLIIGRNDFVDILAYAVSLILIIIGIVNSVKNIISKTDKVITMNFIYSVINISCGALIYFYPGIFVAIFPMLFTLYILIEAVIKTAVFVIYQKNDIDERFATLIRSIISYIFFCIMAFFPLFRENVTYILAGIYSILLASSYIIAGIESMIPIKKMNKFKKKIKIPLPIFIAAFIPRQALKEINMAFAPYKNKKEIEIEKENEEGDIEVLIHLKEGFFASFGHVDLYYKGKVISYGSYDEANVKFSFSIGDGVLFECDKDKYLEFCNTQVNKTIVGFGIKLTDAQKQSIDKKIESVKNDNTYIWYPESKLKGKGKFKDYASRLYDMTEAKFWKFKSR